MLILVFLRMAAETAFYFTFAGLLGPVFKIEPQPLLLSIPVMALAFMLSYLLRNRKALRFLPLLLCGGITFLPGISIPAGIMLLPPFIYMIILVAKKRYEPEYGTMVSILKLYWKLAIPAVIIAALVEYGRTGADDWGQIVWVSGEFKLLSRQTLPLILITLTALVVLTRTLRHDPSVYNETRLVFINLLAVILVAGIALLTSSQWLWDGVIWVLRILATPIIYLMSAIVVGFTRLFMWLISLLPYNPYEEIQPTDPPDESSATMPDGTPVDIDVTIPASIERIITVVSMLIVAALIVLLFWYFMRRRKAALAAKEGGSEERSLVDLGGPKRAFSARTAVSAVRREYQKYLRMCQKEGMERKIDDTSSDVALRSTAYYPRENVEELREIYVAARYDEAGGKEEAKRAKALVRNLKRPQKSEPDPLEEEEED